MKFTQEDLLKKLGIEVDKPFMCDGEKLFVSQDSYSDGTPSLFVFNEDGVYAELSYLLGKEITRATKYTLTETEKHIVLAIDEKFKTLYKLGNDSVALYTVGGERHYLTVFGEIFGSIPLNNYVSLDELKEIAKK